jgi:hypothetical protein
MRWGQTMSDSNPHIRHHVQMPGGEHVEVVYGNHRHCSAGAPSPAYPPVDQPISVQTDCAPPELHVCFNCAGELVYPLDWSEEGPRHWRVILRCPECEARREGVFEQSLVERLDDELDRASGALLSDLKRMTHANMSEEVEFFVRALHADLVLPSDFHL